MRERTFLPFVAFALFEGKAFASLFALPIWQVFRVLDQWYSTGTGSNMTKFAFISIGASMERPKVTDVMIVDAVVVALILPWMSFVVFLMIGTQMHGIEFGRRSLFTSLDGL